LVVAVLFLVVGLPAIAFGSRLLVEVMTDGVGDEQCSPSTAASGSPKPQGGPRKGRADKPAAQTAAEC
jgi:hypothetical protein